MAKIGDLTSANSGGDARDAAIVPGYDVAEVSSPDVKMSVAQIRAPSRDETLNNKQINEPGSTKNGYFAAVQVPGAKLAGMLTFPSTSIVVPTIAAGAESDVAVSGLTGLTTGYTALLSLIQALPAGLDITGHWISAESMTVRFRNASGGSISGASYNANISAMLFQAPDS